MISEDGFQPALNWAPHRRSLKDNSCNMAASKRTSIVTSWKVLRLKYMEKYPLTVWDVTPDPPSVQNHAPSLTSGGHSAHYAPQTQKKPIIFLIFVAVSYSAVCCWSRNSATRRIQQPGNLLTVSDELSYLYCPKFGAIFHSKSEFLLRWKTVFIEHFVAQWET